MELRLALRSLGRARTFAIASIAILGLGIGTAAAMFTVYQAVLVDRLPVIAQDRLVVMNPLDQRGTHLDVPYSYLPVIARDSAVFRGVAGVYHLGAQPQPFLSGSTSIQLGTVDASPNFFDVLGMRPALGRLFRLEDGQAGAAPVIVLSYAAWRRQFGGDSAALGRTLVIPYYQKRATIVGVAPPGFEYPVGADAWLPWSADTSAQSLQVDVVARLGPSVTMSTARTALLALTQRLNPWEEDARRTGEKLPPQAIQISDVGVRSFTDTVLGSSRPVLVVLTLAVGLLLLIACVNVGNLVLVRQIGRAREVAVRRAIGASYADVVRLFAIESALLAVAGSVLATLVAFVLIRLVAVFGPTQLARRDAVAQAGLPLATTIAISFLALLIFGAVPSLVAPRVNLLASLRADSRAGAEGRSSTRVRRWLVTTQMALALVMLAGAALLVRALATLQSMDLGYQPEHLSVLSFTGPQSALATRQQIFDAARPLVARLEATPGVVAASPIESMPFRGQSLFILKLARADQSQSERDKAPFVPFEFVGPDYFRTFGIPLRQGRGFSNSDTKSSTKVVVISETLAHQLWPGQDAVGKRVVITLANTEWTVIGVASDTHFRELKRTGPVAYFDWEQKEPFWNGFVAVRTAIPLRAILPALRAATRDANPNLILWDARTMDQLLDVPMAQPRMSALLLAGFSAAALLLSAIGLYGVMSAAVRQRTRDIGVRVALGATPTDVRRLVLADAMRVVAAGTVCGIVGAVIAARLLSAQLFDVGTLDPAALATAAGVLVAVCACAAYVPAVRATRIDPVEALRSD